MAIIASGLVYQSEIRERMKRFEEVFLNDPEIDGIQYRLDGDWSGDESVFIEIALKAKKPSTDTVVRLSEQVSDALLRILRSEELGLHSYFNFESQR